VRFTGGAPFADDRTLVLARRLALTPHPKLGP
jgi:hypothetical protein